MSFRAHRPAPKGNHSFASGRLYLGIARKARPALLLAERSHRVERPSVLVAVKKRNVRYLKKTHKFGIELPKSVAEAYELDRRNGDTKWADAIAKEMKN
eukprot:scaffold2934_cov90-Alexandrium_tamarense.AAC.2